MKSLLISIVAVTFLGVSGAALATPSGEEALPSGVGKQPGKSYTLARTDLDNFVQTQHRYDARRHKPDQKYRHGQSHHPNPKYGYGKPGYGKKGYEKHGYGKYKQKHYRNKKYSHGKHWDNKYQYRGPQKHGYGFRHGYSRDHYHNKHRNAPSIHLKFGSGGLIHYHSR